MKHGAIDKFNFTRLSMKRLQLDYSVYHSPSESHDSSVPFSHKSKPTNPTTPAVKPPTLMLSAPLATSGELAVDGIDDVAVADSITLAKGVGYSATVLVTATGCVFVYVSACVRVRVCTICDLPVVDVAGTMMTV
jgi:hypothetical protein